MNVKVVIPENLNDITIGQFQQIDAILKQEDLLAEELDNKILSTLLNFEDVEAITVKDRNKLIEDITKALESNGEFKQTFTLDGCDYGLIPNFDKISNGEYTDLIKYANEIEDLHRFMAVAYRPIELKDSFKNYKLGTYKGTAEHSQNMQQLPMSIAKGVQGFFLTLLNDFEKHTPKFIVGEQARE